MPNLAPLGAIFLVAFLLALALTPLVKGVALRYGFVDRPSPRREPSLKPRLGGVAIFLAFSLALLLTGPWVEGRTAAEWQKIYAILVGGAVVVVMGVMDDKRELSPLPQFLAQGLAAAMAVAAGVVIDQITNPFGTPLVDSLIILPQALAYLFTLFWLMGAMNTVNFLDGLDGLAAGVVAIASVVLFLHSYSLTQYSVSLLPLALLGATLGFLPYNFHPARITLGTSGAVFLGYALASLSVLGGTKAATVLLVLGIPILDTAWIILQRLWRGSSPFRADRAHLHHRLLALGLSQPQIVLLLYGVSAGLGALALFLSSRLLKLYALAGMGLLALGLFALLAQRGLLREKAG